MNNKNSQEILLILINDIMLCRMQTGPVKKFQNNNISVHRYNTKMRDTKRIH